MDGKLCALSSGPEGGVAGNTYSSNVPDRRASAFDLGYPLIMPS